MRSSVQGNLINLTTSGINRLDVWVSPRLIDFKKKIEVRLNEQAPLQGRSPSSNSTRCSKTSESGATASSSTTSRSSMGGNPGPDEGR